MGLICNEPASHPTEGVRNTLLLHAVREKHALINIDVEKTFMKRG